ncbi:MAG: hypothetical protein KUG82_22245 [Pseudomonadales bacterium]|nr:hypothetical protein [Pseudomonadales bacterium]
MTLLPRALSAICFFFSIVGCSESPTKTWEQAQQGLYAADLSSNGYSLIASIHHGGSLWRLSDGERIYNWNISKGSYTNLVDVALSTDGKFAVTADDRRLVLWSTKTGKSVGFWNTPSDILSIALSENGLFIFIGMKNFQAIYIDVQRGGILATVSHEDSIRAVAISTDGTIGLTGSDDKTAKLWRLNDGHLLQSWGHDNLVNYVNLSSNGQWAITSGQHSAGNVWNTQSNERVMTIGGRSASLSAVSFSADESRILVGNTAREITLWDIESKTRLAKWTAPKRSMWKPAGARILAVEFRQTQSDQTDLNQTGQSQRNNRILATSSNGSSFEFTYIQK